MYDLYNKRYDAHYTIYINLNFTLIKFYIIDIDYLNIEFAIYQSVIRAIKRLVAFINRTFDYTITKIRRRPRKKAILVRRRSRVTSSCAPDLVSASGSCVDPKHERTYAREHDDMREVHAIPSTDGLYNPTDTARHMYISRKYRKCTFHYFPTGFASGAFVLHSLTRAAARAEKIRFYSS